MNKYLFQFEKLFKQFLITYLFVLTIGVSLGLVFVNKTTSFSSKGAVSRFNGDDVIDLNSDVPANYEKSITEILMTTHNHILGFSFIFLTLGSVFYFNSIIKGGWKKFFMIEPLISIVISFGSIWGIRFVHEGFVFVIIISASFLYLSFFIMTFVSLYELIFKHK